jgi:hypothetical protein
MKRLNKIFITSATLIGLAIGCKDDSLSPYIPPNGDANGLGQFVSLSSGALLPSATGFYDQSAVDANTFFDENNQANGIAYKLQWVSYDSRVNISSIELYIDYKETYSDADRNPLIANHGGPSKGPSYPSGKFWKSITPTAARTPLLRLICMPYFRPTPGIMMMMVLQKTSSLQLPQLSPKRIERYQQSASLVAVQLHCLRETLLLLLTNL